MSALFVSLPLLLAVLVPQGEKGPMGGPLEVVPEVDLARYQGTWFEIARFPNRFQKQCTGNVTATYTLLEDGQIKVVNRCRNEEGTIEEAEGRARRKSDSAPLTKLQVRFAPAFLSFLPFVWGDYWIIDLAQDYSYAVIGEPDRKYLWILSRSPGMDEAVYSRILARLNEQQYDISRLVRTKQDG
jgi:apolipoprotein D and lipocalin family protein